MTLTELADKCKSREAYAAALILLVGFASFGLGRLSKIAEVKTPITIEAPISQIAAAASAPPAAAGGGEVVASKGGTKYHFPWCAGASKIAAANKISFVSVEAARKAGYTPASNCKGLQ